MKTHSALTNRSSRFIARLRVLVVLLWLSVQFAFDSRDSIVAAEDLEAPDSIAVHSVGMTVADMDRSLDFYTRVLSFQKLSDIEVWGSEMEKLQGVFGLRMRVATLRLGDERLVLTEYLTPRGRPMSPDSKGNDQWFQHVAIIVGDMDRAYQRLRESKVVHVSTGPQTLPAWNRSAAGIRAFYFQDPDGHFLEILQFPSDKGDARWRLATEKLFLGIDHTAIVVRDTESSLSFYRDLLGFKIVGQSENFGEEQEHLNMVCISTWYLVLGYESRPSVLHRDPGSSCSNILRRKPAGSLQST